MELQEVQIQVSWLTGRRTSEYSLVSTRDERNDLLALLCEASLIASRLAQRDIRPHPPAGTYNKTVEYLAGIFGSIVPDAAATLIDEHHCWVLHSAAALVINKWPENHTATAAQAVELFAKPLGEKPAPRADLETAPLNPGAAASELPAPRAALPLPTNADMA